MALAPQPDPDRIDLRALLSYGAAIFDLRNRFIRLALRAGRRWLPIATFRNAVYVLRWADVRSVLERPAEFSVRLFGMRMEDTTGITFLGMNPSRPYALEAGAMRAAF